MKNKKASHVGMVLSFVVFVTFIIVLYSLLQPSLKSGRDKDSELNYIYSKIQENTTGTISSLTIVVYSDSEDSCVKVASPSKVVNQNAIAKNLQNIDYLIENYKTYNIVKTQNSEDIIKLFYSKSFLETSNSLGCGQEIIEDACGSNKENCYEEKLFQDDEEIIDSKIIGLIDSYNQDYEKLKNYFGVSSDNDFSFEFKSNGGIIISTNQTSVGVNVYAREIPIIYIDANASKLGGFINLKVW